MPIVDGARTPLNNFGIPPCRSTFMSSMLSAPVSIPATTPADFSAGFGESTLRCSSSRSCSPADSASNNAGTKPAQPTRFGSSKTGSTL